MTLQTNLSAFWQFENTSWTDELGVNSLTGNNSPTSVTGLVGNAVKFTSGASMFLNHANAAALQLGGSTTGFSFQVWVNLTSGISFTSEEQRIMSKNDGGFGNREYGVGIKFSGAQKWFWQFRDSGDNHCDCTSAITVSSGFHQIVGTWDGTTQRIYIDAGAADTNVPGFVPLATTSSFMIGKDGAFATFVDASQDVLVDQVGLWKDRVLSAADVTELYNSGAGLTYAAMAGVTPPVATLYSLINVG